MVTLNGRDHYLGTWKTAASKREYDRLVSEWIAAGRQLPGKQVGDESINELLVSFVRWAKRYYVKEGRVTDEYDCILSAMNPVKELYGMTPVMEFGPLALKAVRERMIAADWSRGYINRSIGRIKRAFKWGVENELVPPGIYHAIKEVAGLAAGRTEARETTPRRPASQEQLDAVRRIVKQRHRDIIDLLNLTAARPSEIRMLTGSIIDRAGPVWVATLPAHKMIHKGKERKLYFGPQAQIILRRYLRDDSERKLFKGFNLRSVIARACERANVQVWTPYQLRHAAATRIREQYGLECAQVMLGHSRADVTQIYAARNEKLALQVAANAG
jgi:integrase